MNKLEQIIESIINGQFKQAREQAKRYGVKRTIDELCYYNCYDEEQLKKNLGYIEVINNYKG